MQQSEKDPAALEFGGDPPCLKQDLADGVTPEMTDSLAESFACLFLGARRLLCGIGEYKCCWSDTRCIARPAVF